MKTLRLFAVMSTAVVVMGLVSCNKDDDKVEGTNQLIGQWEFAYNVIGKDTFYYDPGEYSYLTFNSDGTYQSDYYYPEDDYTSTYPNGSYDYSDPLDGLETTKGTYIYNAKMKTIIIKESTETDTATVKELSATVLKILYPDKDDFGKDELMEICYKRKK